MIFFGGGVSRSGVICGLVNKKTYISHIMTTQEFKDKIMPHHGAMFRVASAILSDSEEAADAVQDSMMRLWQYRDRLAAVADLRTYCIVTARKVRRVSNNDMIGGASR